MRRGGVGIVRHVQLPPALFDRTSAISIDPNTRHSNFAFAAHAAAAHSHFGVGAAQSQYSTSCPTSLDPIDQSGASLHNLGSHMGTSGSYSHELVSMHAMLACNSGSAVAACGLSGDRSGRVGKWQEDKPRASAAALGSSPSSSAPLSSSALKAMRVRWPHFMLRYCTRVHRYRACDINGVRLRRGGWRAHVAPWLAVRTCLFRRGTNSAAKGAASTVEYCRAEYYRAL
jgi:hypothetical protein